jgi:hypothetical protein
MRLLVSIIVVAVMVGSVLSWRVDTASAQAQSGPEGTPQVEASSEAMRYVEAATPQLLTHYWIVLAEIDALSQSPSPAEVKATQLRKRILDLRLIMDLNAYAFEPGVFEAYRDAIDRAYEQLGLYKDLFDVQEIDGFPIDQNVQAERLAKMNVALAALRQPTFREDLKVFFYTRSAQPLALEFKNQPRIWQIAKTGPSDRLDSVGNAALLAQAALRNLRNDGLMVDDIFNAEQEARFHDVRKALRSVLLLADMFPTLTAATASVREPLDRVVNKYGDVNDQFVAFHDAQLSGRAVDQRAAELAAEYAKARVVAAQFVDSGQLEAFAAALSGVQASHQR